MPTAPFDARERRRPRERMLAAVLELSGEIGFEHVTVRHVLERAKASRGSFYNHFTDIDDCFVKAYEEASEWLYGRLRALALRKSSWRDGLRVALAELLQFCADRPDTAKALFIEPHAAGGPALARHDQLMGQLAGVVDLARSEAGSQTSPPPMTASFMVGAIETLIAGKLSSGEADSAPELLPGILHLVVMQYYGKEAAWNEMTSAPLAAWKAKRNRIA